MIIDLNRSRDKLEFSVLNHLSGEMIYELLVQFISVIHPGIVYDFVTTTQ